MTSIARSRCAGACRWRRLQAMLLGMTLVFTGRAVPADPPRSDLIQTETPVAHDHDREPGAQERVAAGVLLLAGLIVLGLTLMAITVVWGARLRRIVRRPVEPSSKPDELWYLHRSARTVGDSPPDDAADRQTLTPSSTSSETAAGETS